MNTYFRVLCIALIPCTLASCASAFLKKSLNDNRLAELHGVSSVNLGAFWLTTTYSNVPDWEGSGMTDAKLEQRPQLASDEVVISLSINADRACNEQFYAVFASMLMSWTSALHKHLGWEGQSEIAIFLGAEPGVYSRSHIIGHGGPPKVTFWLPPPPSCGFEQLETWGAEKASMVMHELAHVVARGRYSDELESEIFARFAQVCADFSEDGTVDFWPSRLTLADAEWAELASGTHAAWSSFVIRTTNLPPTAASAVLVTANFRAFDFPDQPKEVVGEICDAYSNGVPPLKDRMILPKSRRVKGT